MPSLPHPDPEKGVFETMLVVSGRPVELDAHMTRLAASLGELFGKEMPAGARDLVEQRARDAKELARLRLAVAPDSAGGLEVEVVRAGVEADLVFPGWERAVELRSLVAGGGLGAHKWVDRGLLEQAEAGAPRGEVPLLLDSDGTVLEASRANVFTVRDGALATPPTDGRILPGIARAAAIATAREIGVEASEQALAKDDLLAADEVFLTGSVRGIEPVRSLDGVELEPRGEMTARLAAQLRRHWLD